MSNFAVGTLDRTGTLFSIVTTPGDGGAPVVTLVNQGTIYLRKDRDIPNTTVIASGRDAVDIEDVFICRWHPQLNDGWQLNIEGVQYRIVKITEIDRRVAFRLWCRAAAPT